MIQLRTDVCLGYNKQCTLVNFRFRLFYPLALINQLSGKNPKMQNSHHIY